MPPFASPLLPFCSTCLLSLPSSSSIAALPAPSRVATPLLLLPSAPLPLPSLLLSSSSHITHYYGCPLATPDTPVTAATTLNLFTAKGSPVVAAVVASTSFAAISQPHLPPLLSLICCLLLPYHCHFCCCIFLPCHYRCPATTTSCCRSPHVHSHRSSLLPSAPLLLLSLLPPSSSPATTAAQPHLPPLSLSSLLPLSFSPATTAAQPHLPSLSLLLPTIVSTTPFFLSYHCRYPTASSSPAAVVSTTPFFLSCHYCCPVTTTSYCRSPPVHSHQSSDPSCCFPSHLSLVAPLPPLLLQSRAYVAYSPQLCCQHLPP
ncbi:hypothetical protein B296_00046618 [Ensete ventricosum]|uniref:Uncharacterized protein n=1 Tax=Ensete ventricosum TaxID=4639 RepID=A0A426YMS6_ENSVE|nr:hypothetical protein B296_00046618 [Ensete ventricosum]